MNESLYDILGVTKAATADEIRRAYRKLARKLHPDVNPDDAEAEAQFKKVAAAYEVLSDEDRRKTYDEFGEEALRTGFDPDQARAYKQWQTQRTRGAEAVGRDPSEFDFSDLFGGFGGFGGRGGRGGGFGGRTGPIPFRGQDVEAGVQMTLRQAIEGGEVQLAVPGKKPITVRIPPGADDGSVIRLKGRGGPGSGGGPAGDLVIVTRVTPHPHLTRRGLDLHQKVPVSLDEAYNGASIEVPTFDGPIKLRVPPLSQPGAKLRARGKGVARKDKRGDMIIELDVRLPDKSSEELGKAIRDAGELYEQPVKRERSL